MWKLHYDKIKEENYPISYTLKKAFQVLSQENELEKPLAIDLGCGNGVDTFALLDGGFSVLAIDKNPDCLSELKQGVENNLRKNLVFQNLSFEDIDFLPSSYIVNASFSLPFCHPDEFNKLWTIIKGGIKPKGFFCGHFFGPNDSWSSNNKMTFLDLQNIKELLGEFEIFVLEETSKAGKTISGKEKFWHVFHVVARKIP